MALLGLVFALDLLWNAVVGSTGTIAYGIVDEPAHLATCLIVLLAATAVTGRTPHRGFIVAALVASVAIDLDHIPLYLGSHILTGDAPRPYSHGLLTVLILACVGLLVPVRKLRVAILGLAVGVGLHLFRDLATGPGVPLLWPLSDATVDLPYGVFAAVLIGTVAAQVQGSYSGELGLTRKLSRTLLPLAVLAAAAALMAPGRAVAAPPVSIGVYLPGAAVRPSLLNGYTQQVGRTPVIVSTYDQWGKPMFGRSELSGIWSHGAVPLVTWEPWTESEEGVPLRAIASGNFDQYLRRSAHAAAAWGKPLFVRFAHEMNGDWYPWGRDHGNGPRVFKRAWRHVVTIFRKAGARNVKWVWSPYASNNGHFGFAAYFPGSRWIDWVGLDGFNWAVGGAWQSFDDIFAPSYNKVERLTDRPMMIAETGSSEVGGNKARWVARALNRELPRLPRIRALVWFCEAGIGIDPRVDSSPRALSALRAALRHRRYDANRRLFLETPSIWHR